MLSLRAHSIISGCLLAALILIPVVGNMLAASGMLPEPKKPSLILIGVIFALFLGFGFSTVPVMVMTVMKTPVAGPAQKVIIWLMWALMAAGTIVAVPAALRSGVLSEAMSGTDQAEPTPK